MKRRIISVLIIGALLVCMTACGSSKDAASEDSGKKEAKKKASMEEQVLFDQDDIVVTAKDMYMNEDGEGVIDFHVENGYDASVSAGVTVLTVDGCDLSAYDSCGADTGENADGSVTIDADELEWSGIDKLTEVSLRVEVMDMDLFEESMNDDSREMPEEGELPSYIIGTGDTVTIKTKDADDYKPAQPEKKETYYEKNGMSISYLGMKEQEALFGDEEGEKDQVILFWLENTSEDVAFNVGMFVRDTTINGKSIEYINGLSGRCLPGHRGIAAMTLSSSDLEQIGVQSVETMETILLVETVSTANVDENGGFHINFDDSNYNSEEVPVTINR